MSGGNMGAMTDQQSMQRNRHGGGMGFQGSSGYSRSGGGMSGSMGMMGGSSGAGMSHMGDDYGGGVPYAGAGGMADDMSGFGGQSYDQYQSPGGAYDTGYGEQSDAGGPQMDDEDDDMDDDPEFYAMITGKKPADEAKLAQAASGTSKKSAAKAGAGRGGMTAVSGNRGGMQNGGMTGPPRQSMPSGRGAPASGRAPTAGAGSFGAGSMSAGRGQASGATSTGRAADAGRGRDDERVTNAAPRGKDTEPEEIKRSRETCSTEACTVCQSGPHHFSVGKKCPHAFCTTCIQSYFSSGELECPVCGVKNDVIDHKFTQPPSGRILITYDNKNKLPGFDTSHGTIIVTYTFPAGIQTVRWTHIAGKIKRRL